MKKNYLGMLLVFFLLLLLPEAKAQVFNSVRMVNYGDTTLVSSPLTDFSNVVVSLSDSSNSTVDTFKVYIVSPHGDEVLARMINVNDTTSTGYFKTCVIGIAFPGDGTTGVYKILAGNVFKIKIVRTNVASIGGTAVTGKVSYVSISGYRGTGMLLNPEKDLGYQNKERLQGGVNSPGYS